MDEKKVGPWSQLKVLGSGGFGQVTLWHNSNTGQKIAIKKLHDQSLKDAGTRAKQMERWSKEVDIMKKLNHMNVVSTLEIPQEFESIESQPLLAMEYCEIGDLRGVLNKPENCCGLREPEIIDILKDVSNGLAYLHTRKIIHRDLKPENIVLVEKNSRIVYKLIDLGYAKAFDQSSLTQSFVGTIQYIAPELFLGKSYTSSVDYWSFGLLAHEIVTGYRPFLPGFNPSDWMRQIKNKSRDVICVLENASGNISFNTTISRRNHASRCFLERIEKWLRLALDWDGQTRGRDPDHNRPVIFEELGNILCKKSIRVFSIPTYEILDYEVSAESDISDLRLWLKKETDLEMDDFFLLLPSGKPLNVKGNILDALKTEKVERSGISIFLYNAGSISVMNKARSVSEFAKDLLADSGKVLRYRHLKRYLADSVYHLQSEAMLYRNLLRGIGVKITSTKQKTLAIESLHEDVAEEWSQIESYSQFLSLSHKIDLENYIRYRKTGKLKASPMVQKWIRNVIEVDKKINELKNSFDKNQQKQLVSVARQRCRILDNHPGNEFDRKTPLDEIVGEGHKVWEKIQKMSKEGRETRISNDIAGNLIRKSIEETNKLLNSPSIQSLFIKISEADENLSKFLTHLTTVLKSIKILKLVMENVQRERQKNVWDLMGEMAAESVEKRGETAMEDISAERETNPNSFPNGKEGISDGIDGKAEANKNSIRKPYFETGNDRILGVSSIIDDNNRLRHKIQEVQQSCRDVVNEIRSFNFDFVTD